MVLWIYFLKIHTETFTGKMIGYVGFDSNNTEGWGSKGT